MKKPEQLDELFKESEIIHNKMIAIFSKKNIPFLDLKLLSEADRLEWLELHRQHGELGNKICKTIMNEHTPWRLCAGIRKIQFTLSKIIWND